MSDKIFFDEKVLSIVDSWLGESDVKNKTTTTSGSSTAAPLSKVGLGFRGNKKEEKVKDALQVRLDKNKNKNLSKTKIDNDDESNKRKLDNRDEDDSDDDDDMQLHGIVEDMPRSRTQQHSKVKTITKTQPKKKMTLEKVEKPEKTEKTEKTEQKEEEAQKQADSDSIKNVFNNVSNTSSSKFAGHPKTPGTKKTTPNWTPSTTPKTGHWAPRPLAASVAGDGGGGGNGGLGSGEEVRVKRNKTRSKQKNIRKDNRPDSQKPSYIIDSQAENYRGRELTEVRFNCFTVTMMY